MLITSVCDHTFIWYKSMILIIIMHSHQYAMHFLKSLA